MAWIRAALLRLRHERGSAVGVTALVLVTAFMAAAAPRALDHLADSTLQGTIAAAPPAIRNIQFVQDGLLIGSDTSPFAAVDDLQQRLVTSLPASVEALIEAQGWTIDTGRWVVAPTVGDLATMRLRIQPDATGRMHLEQGRWPSSTTTMTPDLASPDPSAAPVTTFEIAISADTATALQLHLGDVITLAPDSSDPLVGAHQTPFARDIGARIVGLYQVTVPSDPWWLNDTSLAAPSVRSPGFDARINDATAVLAPESYPTLLRTTASGFGILRYTFREYVDPGRLRSTAVVGLQADFKRLEAAYPPTIKPFLQDQFDQTAMREGIRQLIDVYQGRWAAAVAVLSIGAIGPAVVALGALGLVIGFAAGRRRSALALARARGASSGQIVSAVVAEGILLSVPATVVGAALALVLVPAGATVMSLVAGAAVVLATVILFVIMSLPAAGGRGTGPARDGATGTGPGIRRLVFDGLVVVIALAGAAVLRQRGLAGSSSAGQLGQADPFVAAVPPLVGLAAALVLVRLVPLPMRGLAWLAGRRRDLVPMLAMRRASDARRVGPVLVVLMVTAAMWAFSFSVLTYLERASDVVAWRDVGAAYRIRNQAGTIPATFDPSTVPGVQAVAVARLSKVNMGPRFVNVDLISLDIAAYDAVTAGTPAALALPAALHDASAATIPIVVSRPVADRPDGVKVNDTFSVLLGGALYPMMVVGVVDDIPGLAAGSQFAIASLAQMAAINPGLSLQPTAVYVRAPPSAAAAIGRAAAAAMPGGASVDSRADETAAIRAAPSAQAVSAGIAAASSVTFLYAALAVAAILGLAGAAEAVEVAHLRTLGLSQRQVAWLVIVEHGPVVATAFAAGIGLGLTLFAVLRQGLGLEAFIGSSVDVSLSPDLGQLAVILGGIVSVVMFGWLLGTLMQRGMGHLSAVRRGFE